MPPTKLSLPPRLLKEIGAPDEQPTTSNGNNSRWKSQGQNRKDRRKAERSQKRRPNPLPQHPKRQQANGRKAAPPPREKSDDEDDFVEDPFASSGEDEAPPKKTPKATERKRKRDESEDDSDDEEQQPPSKQASRATRDKLAQDDAEIDALERKLGIKKRKKLPKAFKDDGLDDLLGEGSDDSEANEGSRSKREADAWLASKRRKAAATQSRDDSESDEVGDGLLEDSDLEGWDGASQDEEDDDDDDEGDGMGDDNSEGSFGDFDSEDVDEDEDQEAEPAPKRVRENPYVAPVTSESPKYVPPSLRKSLGKDADLEARIRRRTQGPVNRVTEANLLSIVGEVEKIYREHPRGLVTNILTDLLMAQICEPTAKPDTLLVLSAGFVAALYKAIGVDFAAHFITTVVERFQQEFTSAREAADRQQTVTKETSNMITVLCEMYIFRIIGSNLVFDYVRLLLDDLSELNAELLLRIVRMAGPQLRKDDPLALKDIVTLIRPAVAKRGEENLSVRTKFMIETISDLKNNKQKAGSQDLAVLNEHVTRMRKLLGSMDTAKTKASEPLRIGLQDIQDADKSGKWWLVGASWAGQKKGSSKTAPTEKTATHGDDDEDIDAGGDDLVIGDELDLPDYAELAREQGMNTDVRRAIFIALVAAADFNDAYLRILKLRLNKYNKREIPNVLVQCSGAQQHYNPYYTLVANKFCADSRIKYSFQDALWTLFRRLGESLFGEEPEEEEDEDAWDNRRLINTAKMFGQLIHDASLGLGVLKPLNLAYVKETTSLIVEVMLITVLQECIKHNQDKEAGLKQKLGKIFGTGLAPDQARAIRYFLRSKVRKTDLVGGKKEGRKVKEACKAAEGILEQLELKDDDEE